jgi:outer membrane immunogenic protein
MSARRLALAFGVLSMASVGAMAADLPTKAPAYLPPPAPVYQWTGCYVGLNAGGVWGRMDDNWTPNPAGFPNATQSARLQANGSGSMDSAGFIGGGQVGCNWQMNQFVLGAEADIQYTGLDGSRDVSVLVPGVGSGVETYHEDFHSKWLATFRGRLGWLLNPTLLVYGTGGLAVANVETNDSVLLPSGKNNSVSDSTTRAGWTVGGGLEWMFMPQWSIKAEYLYVDLGSFSTTSVNSDPTLVNATINNDHHLRENIGRVGVNYHF